MTSFSPAFFGVVEVVNPPASIIAGEEDPVLWVAIDSVVDVVTNSADVVAVDAVVVDVVEDITVTFIWAQTLRPLPLAPPHTYSSISHLQ